MTNGGSGLIFNFVRLKKGWGTFIFVGKLNERRNAMTERLQIYQCEVCGNAVEVLQAGKGQLVCCGQPMKLQAENTMDASREKHVPVLEKTPSGYRVSVGSVPHPMEEKHYIEWVQLLTDGTALRVFFQPGDKPEATFDIRATEVVAREYCNLHGLWKKEGV